VFFFLTDADAVLSVGDSDAWRRDMWNIRCRAAGCEIFYCYWYKRRLM